MGVWALLDVFINISFFGLVDIFDYDLQKSIISMGITKSIGDNNKTGNILTPMNTRIDMIMPYGMQGSDKSTKLNLAYNHKIFYDSNSIGSKAVFKFCLDIIWDSFLIRYQ